MKHPPAEEEIKLALRNLARASALAARDIHDILRPNVWELCTDAGVRDHLGRIQRRLAVNARLAQDIGDGKRRVPKQDEIHRLLNENVDADFAELEDEDE